MVRIGDVKRVDLPTLWRHVAKTGEIGRIVINKVEKKGKQNERVHRYFRIDAGILFPLDIPSNQSKPHNGAVAEWSKAHAWKVCRRETVSRVRILSLHQITD